MLLTQCKYKLKLAFIAMLSFILTLFSGGVLAANGGGLISQPTARQISSNIEGADRYKNARTKIRTEIRNCNDAYNGATALTQGVAAASSVSNPETTLKAAEAAGADFDQIATATSSVFDTCNAGFESACIDGQQSVPNQVKQYHSQEEAKANSLASATTGDEAAAHQATADAHKERSQAAGGELKGDCDSFKAGVLEALTLVQEVHKQQEANNSLLRTIGVGVLGLGVGALGGIIIKGMIDGAAEEEEKKKEMEKFQTKVEECKGKMNEGLCAGYFVEHCAVEEEDKKEGCAKFNTSYCGSPLAEASDVHPGLNENSQYCTLIHARIQCADLSDDSDRPSCQWLAKINESEDCKKDPLASDCLPQYTSVDSTKAVCEENGLQKDDGSYGDVMCQNILVANTFSLKFEDSAKSSETDDDGILVEGKIDDTPPVADPVATGEVALPPLPSAIVDLPVVDTKSVAGVNKKRERSEGVLLIFADDKQNQRSPSALAAQEDLSDQYVNVFSVTSAERKLCNKGILYNCDR